MKFFYTILLLTFLSHTSSTGAEKEVITKSIMTVSMDTNGTTPYSKDAPVGELYSTLHPILGQLLYINEDYDLTPGLLKSFYWNHEKESYHLKLKDNLVFHNGRKATAKDLEFSILRSFFTPKKSFSLAFLSNIKGIEKLEGTKKFQSGAIEGVKIINDYELEIKIKTTNPSFLHSLSRPMFSLVPIEEFIKSDYEQWKNWPIGAGAYKVSKIDEKNKYLILDRTSHHPSRSDSIKIDFSGNKINSDVIINDMTENNQYDINFSKKSVSVASIFFNFNSKLGSNINFRKAVHHLINRKELVGDDSAKQENQQFLASHFWGRIKTTDDYSLQSTKSLLSQIKGLSDNKKIKIPVFGSLIKEGEDAPRFLNLLKNQFQKAGLNIAFFKSPNKYFSKDDKDTPFRLISLGADIADPMILFNLMKGKNSPLSPHFPENDTEYEKLINLAASAESLEKKILSTKKISKYFYDKKIAVTLFEEKMFTSIKKESIQSVGQQNGGLTFYLDRVTLHGRQK